MLPLRVRELVMIVLCSCLGVSGYSQIQITAADQNPFTPENLISNILLGQGVAVNNVVHTGTTNSVGYFTNGFADIGLNRGIVMSTGMAVTAASPNNEPNTGSVTSSALFQDNDLAQLTSTSLRDITKYEITFVPSADTLRFNYVFASEEYPEFVCSNFNDVFGFFITGPNPAGGNYNGVNIAKIPNPSGVGFSDFPVAINSVNSGVIGESASGDCGASNETLGFSQYYNANSTSSTFTFDGYIDAFIAEALVVPCQEYTIKLAIADGMDVNFDSAVFLEAKSFSTGIIDVALETLSIDGSLAEGCNDGDVKFSLPSDTDIEYNIDFNILSSGALPNIATPGIDYIMIPNTLVIPAGSNSVEIPLQIIEDNLVEGTEFIYIDYQANECSRDTIQIPIRDNILTAVNLPNDTTLCDAENFVIQALLPNDFMLPMASSFTKKSDVLLGNLDQIDMVPTNQPDYYLDLEVSGVFPSQLSEGLIDRVCIDTFIVLARDLPIYDFYLIGPDGQVLILMTDIGDGLDDGSVPPVGPDVDTLTNVCFTPQATQNINNGNPVLGPYFPANPTYTGSFQPEGTWSDIWSNVNSKTNGTWSLLVTLDSNPLPYSLINDINKITSWSIHFNSVYELDYQWSDDTGPIDCVDCQEIIVNPTGPINYYLDLVDSYGCTVKDTMFVGLVENALIPQNVQCNVLSNSSLEFTWDPVLTGIIEIFTSNSGGWIPTVQNGFTFTGLGFGDTETIMVRINNNGCIGDVVTVTCMTPNCNAPNIMVDEVKSPTCISDQDGSFQISATGTVGPYQFDLDGNVNGTGLFENLASGTYMPFVTDGAGCSISVNVVVPVADQIISSPIVISPISCQGKNDAAVTFKVMGDLGPHDFNWNTSSADSILTNIGDGSYFVTITDIKNCKYLDTIMLTDPVSMVVDSLITIAESCFNAEDGQAEIFVSGGTPPYSYSLDNVTFGDANSLIGLSPGLYIMYIQDNNGCEITEDFEIIGSSAALDVTVDIVDQVCIGDGSGSADLTISGGSPPYNISWMDGSNFNTIDTVGVVSATVTDMFGCSFDISETIGSVTSIEVDTTISNVTCNNGSDGVITLTTTGGTGLVSTYYSSIQLMIPSTEFTGSQVSGLSSGIYQIEIIDENLCSEELEVTIDNKIPIAISADIEDTGCNGTSTGSITPSITNTSGTIQYSWIGPSIINGTIPDQNNLASGLYTLSIIDGNNCSASQTFEVKQNTSIDYSLIKQNILCKGDTTGFLLFNTTSGISPLTYTLSDDNGYFKQDSTHFNISAGEYYVDIMDAQGCQIRDTVSLLEPQFDLAISFDGISEACYNTLDRGRATAIGLGGTSPYSVLWDNGDETAKTTKLIAGQFNKITITDNNGCQMVDSIFTEIRDSLIVDVDITPASCFNAIDAVAQLTGATQGGSDISLSVIDILWSLSGETDFVLDDLYAGGVYSITVTDNLGCTGEQLFEIDNPEPISTSLISNTSVNCFGGDDGSLTVMGNGGSAPYTYKWSANADFQTDATAINLSSSNYVVTVTDDNGCTSTFSASVDQPTVLNALLRPTDVACFGDSTGQIDMIVGGATSPYSLTWSNMDTTLVIDDLALGMYSVTIEDANGCITVDSAFVNQPIEPIDFTVDIYNSDCDGDFAGGMIVDATGGNGNYIFSTDSISYVANNELIALGPDTYTVYVKDGKGCLTQKTGFVINETQGIVLDLGIDLNVAFNDQLTLVPEISSAFGQVDYDWEVDGQVQVDCIDCATLNLDSIQSQVNVTLNITDENGCTTVDRLLINLVKFIIVDVPTGFTPNADGQNDILHVFGKEGTVVLDCSIFDRWGELIYQDKDFYVNDITRGWNGTFKNKLMPPGMYVWKMHVRIPQGTTELLSGTTTLIR